MVEGLSSLPVFNFGMGGLEFVARCFVVVSGDKSRGVCNDGYYSGFVVVAWFDLASAEGSLIVERLSSLPVFNFGKGGLEFVARCFVVVAGDKSRGVCNDGYYSGFVVVAMSSELLPVVIGGGGGGSIAVALGFPAVTLSIFSNGFDISLRSRIISVCYFKKVYIPLLDDKAR